MKKVICIGNRFVHPDGAALWVYDAAVNKQDLTSNARLEWVEGGLGGLNLITHFENITDLLFLDYFKDEKNATFFTLERILESVNITDYTHDSAFYYLLNSLDTLLTTQPKISFLACNPDSPKYIDEVLENVELWEAS